MTYRSLLLMSTILVTSFFSTPLHSSPAPVAPIESVSPELSLEELFSAISTIINELLSQLNIIITRIDNLTIQKEVKQTNTTQLLYTQEKLLKVKANIAFYAQDREKLVKLLPVLAEISSELEKGVKESFTTPLLFQPHRHKTRTYNTLLKKTAQSSLEKIGKLTRSLDDTLKKLFIKIQKKHAPSSSASQDPLAQLIYKTEKNIAETQALIQNLGKTFINRGYIRFNNFYHSTLFTIPPLGNIPVTPASITNRFFIYGLNFSLILVNLNQKIVNTIPFKPLRNRVTSIKERLGHNSTVAENVVPVTTPQTTSAGSFVLLPTALPSSQSVPLGLNPDRFITLQHRDNKVIIEKENDKLYVIEAITGLRIQLPNNDTSCIRSIANVFKCSKGSQEILFLQTYDPLEGNPRYSLSTDISGEGGFFEVNPTREEIQKFTQNGNLTPHKALVSFIGQDGTSINPNIVYAEARNSTHGYKIGDIIPGYGPINKLWSLLSTVVEPDFKAAFTLPISAYLASFIYEDANFIRERIPTIKSWIHSKLSGIQTEVKGIFKIPNFDFSKVIGRNAIKEKLMPYIKFVENPNLALQGNIRVPRGIIFAGEPQTGKTMMAEAFAGELSKAVKKQGNRRDFKMIEVSVSDLLQIGLKFIKNLKQYAPCLVFCDEFELTGAQRDQNKELLANFLVALNSETEDDLDSMVFFLVATNYPENIDNAIKENGRLGTHIFFETPSPAERRSYFMHEFNKANINTLQLDIDELVQETAACSYGMLKDVVSGIKSRAQYEKEVVNQQHINATLDDLVRRIIVDEYDIPQEQRIALAARYGAQAFTSLLLNPNKKFIGATIFKITPDFKNKIVVKNYELLEKNSSYTVENKKILQDAGKTTGMIYGGFFSYNTQETYGLVSHKEKLKLCKVALAGTVGQEVLGLDYIDFDSDMLLAFQYARDIVLNGIKEELLPKAIREEKRMETYNLIQTCKQEVRALLEAHKEEYKKIVDLLQKRYIIRTSDIKECFNLKDLDLTTYFSGLHSQSNA